MSGDIKVSYKVTCECWSDGQVLVIADPTTVPAEVFFNAAATIIHTIVSKSGHSLDAVMDHLMEHVLAARRIPKQQ